MTTRCFRSLSASTRTMLTTAPLSSSSRTLSSPYSTMPARSPTLSRYSMHVCQYSIILQQFVYVPLPTTLFHLHRDFERRTGTCCAVTLSTCFRLAAWTSSELSLVFHLMLSIAGTWLISKLWQPLLSGLELKIHILTYRIPSYMYPV